MTLAELQALDFEALWGSLTPAQQARIGVLALTNEFATSVSEDDGFDASDEDRVVAGDLASDAINELPEVIQEFFPAIVFNRNELCEVSLRNVELAQVEPGKVRVKDVQGLRRANQGSPGHGWTVRLKGQDTYLGGIEPVGTDEAPAYICWTAEQVDAERRRRHPGQISS